MSKSKSLKKTFSEFDTNKTTHSEITDSLLYPEHEDYEYRRIRNAVICHGKLSKEDASAILLQKTYRMFRIRRLFSNYYRQFQHVKKVTMRPYFIAFVLNSHASHCDRRKLYETQFSRTLFCHKIFKGYTHPPFEVFTVTDQCLLSPYIDCSVLSQFVKKFYHSLILKAFLEWRIIARKQILERKHRAQNDVDVLKRQLFGNEYVCFHLWYRYTKRKSKKKMNANARIPQWDYYMNLIDKKNSRYQKALEIRKKTIKKAAIQALLNSVIEKREEENVLIEADRFRVKRNMIFALSAWAHYIVIQHNKVNTARTIIREWFRLIKQKIHFRELLKKFQPRHSYFQKRAVLTIFIKNRQISQINSSYLYCKIQTKPSLALYFLSVLTHDDDVSPFYLAMHAWASYYRRRKKWQHFIFQDIKTSNYDTARRKALSCLRNHHSPLLNLPINFTSPHFQQETLFLYEYVMKMKTESETIFLLSSDEEAKEAVANSTSTAEQRKLFFKMWLGMRDEPTLLMRLATINMQKRRAEKANEAMRQAERTLAAYQKATTFLESYNLASDKKFQILKKTINDNNKKALANRIRCVHRDKMIIYAHYSHFDAESLKVVKPLFMTNDKLRIVSKIKEATEELTESFQFLTSIAGLGKSLNSPNTSNFSQIHGCMSPVQPFDVDHKALQTDFKAQMKKGQLSPITQIQFERLMAGYENDTSYKNLKTYQRMDPYATPLVKAKPMPFTGVNQRLLQAFPLKGRKQIQVGQTAKKKLNFNVINSQKAGDEEEEEFIDEDDYNDAINYKRPGIINAYDKSKGSMFFNSLKSFSNIISQSSFSLFSSSARSIEMNTGSISVPVEEVIEEGSSDYSDESESNNSENEIFKDSENSIIADDGEHQLGLISKHKRKHKIIGIVEDDVGNENEQNEEKMIDLKETHPTQFNQKVENKQERKTVTFKGLNDGFDEELMKSINMSEPPKSPKASNKVKLFIEILFGRASKNQISTPMMKLKNRLIQELKNQKEGSPIPGIRTQETVMPIGNLLELYHEEKERKANIYLDFDDEIVDDSLNTKQREMQNSESCSVTYQSKRYRPLPKKEKEHHHHHHHEHEQEQIKPSHSHHEIDNEEDKEKQKGINSIKSKESIKSTKSSKSDRNQISNDDEENPDENEYYDEYEDESDTEGVSKSGRKKRRKRKENKESSRSKNKTNKELSRSKNKTNKESSRSRKDKSNESESKIRSSRKKDSKSSEKALKTRKKKETNESKSGRKKSKRKGTKKRKNGNNNNEYEYEYDEYENKNYSYSSSSDLEDFYRERTPVSQLPDSPRDKIEINEEESEGKEVNINEIDSTQQKENDSDENSIDKRPAAPTSSQGSRALRKRRGNNSVTPFISSDNENPMSSLDKLVFNYLKENLEEEEQVDLVDVDDNDETQKVKQNDKKKVAQNKVKLWKPPKFTSVFARSNPLSKKTKLSSSAVVKINQPIVIKQEAEITPSMRQAIHEESVISKILYHNGQTLIRPAKKTSNSLTRPSTNQYLKNSQSSLKSLYVTNNFSGNIKFEKMPEEISKSSSEQVVTFGGGGRGISEEGLNMQRIRMIRNLQLLNRQKRKEEEEFISQNETKYKFNYANDERMKKAKEYEDLSTHYSNLRSVVTQLIQMMASSQDDSNEFETLRKRAKFLRKKPAFVGLKIPNKLSPEQFYNQIQMIYMKYTRKKNAHATADELFKLMKNNLEFAPLILKVIDKTANEEQRYIDSKLQNSRLGRQKTEQGMTIHFIDLDWMSNIPDYKFVHLQYKMGFDQPENLEAIVAPIQEDNKISRFANGHGKHRRRQFKFADPSNTNWDRTLSKFELQDLVMISKWVPEELMNEVIADHRKNMKHNYINGK